MPTDLPAKTGWKLPARAWMTRGSTTAYTRDVFVKSGAVHGRFRDGQVLKIEGVGPEDLQQMQEALASCRASRQQAHVFEDKTADGHIMTVKVKSDKLKPGRAIGKKVVIDFNGKQKFQKVVKQPDGMDT